MNNFSKATLGGGCFWCMEPPFLQLNGVVEVRPGYMGGHTLNPTYEDVCTGKTGHIEVVQVTFDPALVTFSKILDLFWQQIDPTDSGGQFYDRGTQYATVIFYHDSQQSEEAEASKKRLTASGRFSKPIVTGIIPATVFYPAEDYHHRYFEKNTLRYKTYRASSGRDQFLAEVWRKK